MDWELPDQDIPVPPRTRAANQRIRDEQAARLRQARELDGRFAGPREAAAALKFKESTYTSWENGTRGIGGAYQRLAREYGVAPQWLLAGTEPMLAERRHPLVAAYDSLSGEGQKYINDAFEFALYRWGPKSR